NAPDAFGNHNRALSKPNSWLRALPFVILLITGILLVVLWNYFPERWPQHWNGRGEIDGWATKTPAVVFFPVILGVLLCGFFELIAFMLLHLSRASKAPRVTAEAARAIAVATAEFLYLISAAAALLFAATALALPLLRPQLPTGFVVFAVATIA